MIGRWRLPGVAHPGAVIGVLVLVFGTRHLTWRYHASAAYEFPVAFTLFTLLWCSAVTLLLAAWTVSRHGRSRALRELFPRTMLPTAPLALSVVGVVARTAIWGSTRQYMQCEVEGVHAFLPTAIVAVEVGTQTLLSKYAPAYMSIELAASKLAGPATDELPESKPSDGDGPATRGPLVRYIVISLVYGFLVHQMLVFMQRPVGAICPSYNGAKVLVPAGQISMLAFDAVVIAQVARWRRRADDSSNTSWASLAALSVLSALALGLIAAVFAAAGTTFGPFAHLLRWAPSVQGLILHDLLVDSAVAAVVLVSAVTMLALIQPTSLVAAALAAGIVLSYIRQLKEESGLVILPGPGHAGWAVVSATLGAILVLLFFLGRPDGGLSHGHGARKLQPHAWSAVFIYPGLVAALMLFLHSRRPDAGPAALQQVVDRAWDSSELWMQSASFSKSLAEAVEQYQQRYLTLPPPHFDKWYAFATAHNSPIIDTFDQIHNDLLPFWGVPPAVLRNYTTHLLEQTRAGIGGFSIRNHTIKLSPLTPGSHFWMMDGYREMVEPYLQWLPDLDMAFNIDDECRVVVPFDDMEELIAKGSRAQSRIQPYHSANASFSPALDPPWTARHLEEGFKEAHKDDPLTPFITFRHKFHSVFDTYIAPTCHPSSPALHQRWWSRKECSPEGRGVVEDVDLSVDVCQRPDLARMHGYLLDPAILGVSTTLLPIFSQSRVAGYADIIVPSPWNYFEKVKLDEDADLPWEEKLHSVFWRGSASDGASRHGTWTSFLRARFAHLAQLATRRGGKVATTLNKMSGNPATNPPHSEAAVVVVNASFVGNFGKGVPQDNRAQNAAFYGGPETEPPAGLDFQEHWRHRHLVDLDGAAFSGRFIPFLQSRSLPYRAALFRTWYEERVHAWRHYVPLDVSLSNLWGLVGEMDRLGGGARKGDTPYGQPGDSRGASMGEDIALEGRAWARKALRKEDMQIYMFRLLLEWARLIDDNRETLGFAVP
ncbi:hypothetical protein GE09DRAFT_1080785 [Coniochaeta sp. 2T2.1]|nr:hypothetical protein GE09DRAFT_1080785 [Coniochaeta sp. 2T2.1]